jgi:REP element-mobilizing transposase RayT
VAGCAHHIVQRGNNRQDVFFVDDDRRVQGRGDVPLFYMCSSS